MRKFGAQKASQRGSDPILDKGILDADGGTLEENGGV